MTTSVNVIIVTHNSEDVIDRCISALDHQSFAIEKTIIIDSGSDDASYLDRFRNRSGFSVCYEDNIGFGAANNRGITHLTHDCRYLLFINPDTFVHEASIHKAVEVIEHVPDAAIITGMLEGYDLQGNTPTGCLDSTGIFRSWFGRWYDRGMGRKRQGNEQRPQYIPAVCGAFMFCRMSAIKSEFPELFDESLFMYKEDIELCLRLAATGWKFYYTPDIQAYHCRGWNRKRSEISRQSKLMSAENEIKMYRKHPSIYYLWAMSKYILVKYFGV